MLLRYLYALPREVGVHLYLWLWVVCYYLFALRNGSSSCEWIREQKAAACIHLIEIMMRDADASIEIRDTSHKKFNTKHNYT